MLSCRDAGLSFSVRFLLPRSVREEQAAKTAQAAVFMAPAVISRLRRRSSAS